MKRLVIFALLFVFLAGCDNNSIPNPSDGEIEAIEQKDEMLDSAVRYYLNELTNKYSQAYLYSMSNEEKMNTLNEAITDINIVVMEIEDDYQEGVPPKNELLDLADALLETINHELIGDTDAAYDSSYRAGKIIGDLSREYLDGELPIGIKLMTEKESAFD